VVVCGVTEELVQGNRYVGTLTSVGSLVSGDQWGILGIATEPVSRLAIIQVRRIWAKLGDINGSNMSGDGVGCIPIMVSASKVLGPHSFECGLYVMELQ
jgi:hypothetical protein